jgi:uncharacterized protein
MHFLESIHANLATPAILFFVLGVIATSVKTDLRFPEPLYLALTVYLLAAIGFKGGVAVSSAGLAAVWLPALGAVALGSAIPFWCYGILRYLGRLPAVDAAAIGAHYGSVSAVTFIAAVAYLTRLDEPYEAYASAFLAVMESPAIIVGVVLGKLASDGRALSAGSIMRLALHEGLLGRSVFLLLGSLVIGYLCGERGLEATAGFFITPFQGILSLFMLEMGMVAARRFGDLRKVGPFLLVFGVLMPVIHGALGIMLGAWTGLSLGGTVLLGVLASSASYIAAPAAMRLSLPEANPTLYLTAALAITFPFNITFGLPLYYEMARWWFAYAL